MKIQVLKSGKFAHPDPGKPQIYLKEGTEIDVDDAMWDSMVESKWGEPVAETPVSEKPLSKMKKDELIEFAEKNLIPLDRILTNEKMVIEIEKTLKNE